MVCSCTLAPTRSINFQWLSHVRFHLFCFLSFTLCFRLEVLFRWCGDPSRRHVSLFDNQQLLWVKRSRTLSRCFCKGVCYELCSFETACF